MKSSISITKHFCLSIWVMWQFTLILVYGLWINVIVVVNPIYNWDNVGNKAWYVAFEYHIVAFDHMGGVNVQLIILYNDWNSRNWLKIVKVIKRSSIHGVPVRLDSLVWHAYEIILPFPAKEGTNSDPRESVQPVMDTRSATKLGISHFKRASFPRIT